MKKSVILSVVLSLAIFSGSFANTIKDSSKLKLAKAISTAKAPKSFSSAEQEFFNELDEYYYETFEKPAEDISKGIQEEGYKNVIVYNLGGEVITTKKEEVPTNADVLMKDGDTIYYIIY